MKFEHIAELQPVALLRALHEERNKYTESNKEYMAALVNKLVELGVYPAFGFNGRYPALQMVEGYGIDWHQFDAPHYCPLCQSDLRDWEAGAPGKREIYVKPDPIKNDHDPYFMCPDCKGNITEAVATARSGRHAIRDQ